MATKAQLEKYLKNPRVRKFLDLIAHTEGTEGNGYHTAFGGGRLGSLNDHPRYLKTFKQQNGKTNKTSAAGRYQFLKSTWDGLAKQYGLSDFGPKNQDLGAVALLAQNGALGSILKGDMTTAVRKSGATWASLPTAPASYSQPTKSWRTVNRFLGGKGVSNAPRQEQLPQPLGTDWNAFKNKIEGGQSAPQPKPLGTDWAAFKSSIDGEQDVPQPQPLGTDWTAFKSSIEGDSAPVPTQVMQPLGTDWNSFKQSIETQEPSQPDIEAQPNIIGGNYGSRI
ncbi:glycoside hydrolase family 104 protein [Psychrobacter sp. UBA2514]|jgi:muramidase (phage lysozyme)|uniref:glycoside hydrolase family 24 protein n=1 Tax=Psychrobacter sp. UBA2514 TaxID=1947346 RepID=UPI00257D8F62|nr:glycoside hydrolase family 104 protein [Psychrobacter sp. UBA2514]|tara:strand:+ start:9937 stop:10776 length:840 start_codon:yes stop_codon:yes gene_type:complete